jgi:hypothetical protein
VLRVEKKRKPQHCLRGLSVRGGWEEGGCRPRTSHQSERKRKANKHLHCRLQRRSPATLHAMCFVPISSEGENGFVTDSGRASRAAVRAK